MVRDALLVSNRALRKWINCFNQAGVDGLIVKKRPGRMSIITDQQAPELAQLIDQPEKAKREFWTAKAFDGYNYVCKNEEKLIERLDQAILDVIDNPDTIKQTTAIGTLF